MCDNPEYLGDQVDKLCEDCAANRFFYVEKYKEVKFIKCYEPSDDDDSGCSSD